MAVVSRSSPKVPPVPIGELVRRAIAQGELKPVGAKPEPAQQTQPTQPEAKPQEPQPAQQAQPTPEPEPRAATTPEPANDAAETLEVEAEATDDLPDGVSKSYVIRQLHDQGYSVKQIAHMLGIRYQFAYNVVSRYKLAKIAARVQAAEAAAKLAEIRAAQQQSA